MKKVSIFMITCLLTLLIVPAVYAASDEVKDPQVDIADEIITMAWLDRLKWESEDKTVKIKIGGLYGFDWAQINDDYRVASVYNSVQKHKEEVRWAEPSIELTLFEDYKFKFQYEIVGKRGQMLDVWGEAKRVPFLGTVKIGQFKEPFSMSVLAGRTGATMMEYAPSTVFAQARNLGIQSSHSFLDKRVNLAVGVFNKCNYLDNAFSDGNEGIDMTGRVGWRPYLENEGKQLLHVGAAYSHQFLDGDTQKSSYSPTTGSNLSSIKLTGTGSMNADGQDLGNFEIAGVYNQFWFQSELSASYVDVKEGNNAFFTGYYIDAGYILTGETKPFNSANAVFGAVVPTNPFNPMKGGWGALELATQFSHTDLNDSHAGIRGGVQDNIGVALNWYLNSHTRLVGNYIHSGVSGRDNSSLSNGEMDIYQCRLLFNF